MRIGIVGGGLQGLEAAYLAGKAGWEVRLLDRKPVAPACGLAACFAQGDACDPEVLDRELGGADLVLPALEDASALETLCRWAGENAMPLAFDLSAYAVSSSKLASNRLFRRLGLPLPREWPECGLPVLVKPDGLSGSRGVRVFREQAAWQAWRQQVREPGAWVAQEYLEGPSYSIEVLGSPDAFRPLQVTALDMDAGYDCKRVRAPAGLSAEHTRQMEKMAVDLAEALALRGLMDLEVILNGGQLKLLEIDARLPSQTPITVFWSTGYNMVGALAAQFLYPEGSAPDALVGEPARQAAVLEHVRVTGSRLEVSGEHVLAGRGAMRLERDFYGADEALTDLAPDRNDWVATLIVTAGEPQQAWSRRCQVIEAIRRAHRIEQFLDPEPPA